MEGKSVLKVLALIIFVHLYIFLSALVYRSLEIHSPTTEKNKNAEAVLQRALLNGAQALKNLNSTEHKSFMKDFHEAIENDKREEMRAAFDDLTKAYLFSLTTVTTVGNSGMYLQTWSAQLFFVFSILPGIILYAVMLHNIAVILLETFKQAAEMLCFQHGVQLRRPQETYPKIQVIIYCYGFLFLSVLILGLGGLVSGHSYVFGIYSSVDVLLTVGNQKWLEYIQSWNKITFVISMDLILMLELSLLYTTAYATLHAFKGTNWSDIVSFCWKDEEQAGYSAIGQDDEDYHPTKPVKSGDNKGLAKQPEYESISKNPFLDNEPPEIPDEDGLVPTLLDPIQDGLKADSPEDRSGITFHFTPPEESPQMRSSKFRKGKSGTPLKIPKEVRGIPEGVSHEKLEKQDSESSNDSRFSDISVSDYDRSLRKENVGKSD